MTSVISPLFRPQTLSSIKTLRTGLLLGVAGSFALFTDSAHPMEEAHKLMREGDYPAAAARYAKVSVDSENYAFRERRFAELQVWYAREEAFREVSRDLLSGRLDQADVRMGWIRSSLARDDSPFEDARLMVLDVRLLQARGKQEEAAEKAWSVLDVPGPFLNVEARSEALYLLHAMALESDDTELAQKVEATLRAEREVHPFWAARILPDTWQEIGAPGKEEYERIIATAGKPEMPKEYAELIDDPDTIRVTDVETLRSEMMRLAELPASRREGTVVFVPGDADLDLTEEVLIVPGGVTLLSDRGIDGSPGAILRRNDFTEGGGYVVVLQSGAGLVGFRVLGEMEKWTPTYDETRTSPPGRGVALGRGHDHGRVINCEIANVRRDGISNFGRYLHVKNCHIHNFGAYGILSVVNGRWTIGENNKIEWAWQGVGGSRTWNTGYQMYGNYLLDARTPELSIAYQDGPFSFGSAMGHHGRVPQGYSISVVGNVFERTSEEVLSYRTVSPRSGVEYGVFIGHNWVRQPHFAEGAENLPSAMKAIRIDEGRNNDTYVMAHFAKEDADLRDIELRTRMWPGNLFSYANRFGEEAAVLEEAAFSRSLVRWLEPGLMPPMDNEELHVERVLQQVTPGPDASVKTAWLVRAFPGRNLKSVRLLLEGPFESSSDALPIGPINPEATVLFKKELDNKPEFYHEEEFALGEIDLEPGVYRLLIVAEDNGGREAIHPGYFNVPAK